MSDKEDIRKALEASRKSGPMDESMVRGTAELSTKNDGGSTAGKTAKVWRGVLCCWH